jgi:hypothetical protein
MSRAPTPRARPASRFAPRALALHALRRTRLVPRTPTVPRAARRPRLVPPARYVLPRQRQRAFIGRQQVDEHML